MRTKTIKLPEARAMGFDSYIPVKSVMGNMFKVFNSEALQLENDDMTYYVMATPFLLHSFGLEAY